VPLYFFVTGRCWIQVVFVFQILGFVMTRLYNLVSTAIVNNVSNPHVRTLDLKLDEICR
jgi:hypothetical protein